MNTEREITVKKNKKLTKPVKPRGMCRVWTFKCERANSLPIETLKEMFGGNENNENESEGGEGEEGEGVGAEEEQIGVFKNYCRYILRIANSSQIIIHLWHQRPASWINKWDFVDKGTLSRQVNPTLLPDISFSFKTSKGVDIVYVDPELKQNITNREKFKSQRLEERKKEKANEKEASYGQIVWEIIKGKSLSDVCNDLIDSYGSEIELPTNKQSFVFALGDYLVQLQAMEAFATQNKLGIRREQVDLSEEVIQKKLKLNFGMELVPHKIQEMKSLFDKYH